MDFVELINKINQSVTCVQPRWMGFLFEFDFEIKHVKGKDNKVANALIRREHTMHAKSIRM